MYNFDDVMIKLDDMEKKIDELIESRDYDRSEERSSYQLNNRFATVFKTPNGTFGINMKENGEEIGRKFFPGKSESYADDAADNFVHRVNS